MSLDLIEEMTPTDEQKNQAYDKFLHFMYVFSEERIKEKTNKIIFQFEINNSDESITFPPELGFDPQFNSILKVDDISEALIGLRQLGFNFHQPCFRTDTIKNIQIMNVAADYSRGRENCD